MNKKELRLMLDYLKERLYDFENEKKDILKKILDIKNECKEIRKKLRVIF